jgi:hypothetical protein
MHSINCVGKDGVERKFVLDEPEIETTSEGHRELTFRVMTESTDIFFFELSLREQPDGCFQIIMIENHHRPEYVSKGIPDALLPFLHKMLGRPICSSRPSVTGTNEFRTVDATKMWDRLVRKGIARYFADKQIYRTV